LHVVQVEPDILAVETEMLLAALIVVDRNLDLRAVFFAREGGSTEHECKKADYKALGGH
jgi:hypothetical protein